MLALFCLTFFHLGRGAVDSKEKISLIAPTETASAEALYVPSIGVGLDANLSSDCAVIDYTVAIRNTSTNNESLIITSIIDVNDPLFIVPSLVATVAQGDLNGNGLLDAGESWALDATRLLSATDLNADTFQNQATVTAEVFGQPGNTVNDLSHPDQFNEDAPTVTDISNCRRIGTLLFVETKDWWGNQPGCETIEYRLSVRHMGVAKESLTITDVSNSFGPVLNFALENPNAGDTNNNGLLDLDENWKFTASRPLNQTDYDAFLILEQVKVTTAVEGNPLALEIDLSHRDNLLDDAPTDIYIECEKGTIALTKEAQIIGDCDEIEYTLVLTHLNNVPHSYQNIVIQDPQLGDFFAADVVESITVDAILEPGETWTMSGSVFLTQDDIIAGQVTTQAYAVAEIKDILPFRYSVDASDPTDLDLDRETVTDLTACAPRIAIVKKGIENSCNNIEYTFYVTNESGNGHPLHNVIVTDDLVPTVTYVSGDDGDNILQIDEAWEYTGVHVITAQNLEDGEVENTGHVFAEDPILGITVEDWSDFENVDEDRPTVTDLSSCQPGITILKTGTVDANCANIDYTLTVNNKGSQDLENVVVSDPLMPVPALPDSGDNGVAGVMEIGETWIFTASYAITAQNLTDGQVDNRATVDANVLGLPAVTLTDESHPSDTTLDGDTTTDLSGCVPNINILKTGTVDANCANIDYVLTVNNNGSQDLENVVVSDPLMPVPALPDSGDNGVAGVMEIGETWVFTASYAITALDLTNGQVDNRATVDANVLGLPAVTLTDESHPTDTTLDGDTTTDLSGCVPNINILKTGTVDANCANIDYVLTVNNNGNQDLENVVVNDPLMPVPALPDSGDNGVAGIMEIGETWVFTASYAITALDLTNGQVDNRATVDANVLGLPAITVTDESHPTDTTLDGDTTTDLSGCVPNINIIKTGTVDANCANIDYTLTVNNNGNQDLENVVVSDPLMAVPALPDSGDLDNDNVLDIGETWVFTASYAITALDLTNGQVDNRATVDANVLGLPVVTVTDESHPSDTTLDGDTTTDLSGCVPRIALIKQGISKGPLGNDGGCTSIAYTFLVTNESESGAPLENISITDSKLNAGDITLFSKDGGNQDNLLELGETWVYTANYVLTAEDITLGEVENTAHVTASEPNLGIVVEDDSDFENVDEDRSTVTDISECAPKIALIKTGVAYGGQGEEGGCAFIDYTFTVSNESTKGQVLENITIADQDLPIFIDINFPPTSGDVGNDGLLGPDEIWVYENIEYQLNTADRLAGQVENTAIVTATMEGFAEITVEDTSDFENTLEDRPTVTLLGDCEPRIALIKEGVVNADCSAIDYTFTLTIESTTNESFENVVVTDLDLPLVIQGPQGDGNFMGIFEPGETWTYTATQPISPDDINFGCFHNQAQVIANVLAYPDYMVQDLSDDDSPDEDDVTEVDLSTCQNPAVGLIKEAELLDINNDNCPESVSYTFTVTNMGDVALHQAILNDDMLNGEVPGPTPESDDGGDGILSVGESWTYQAIYNIVQTDIDNGFVENTATVTMFNLCNTAQVVDTSDDNSNTENDSTNITIPNDACTDGNASIGLIKTGAVQDANQDNCPESILYTFTVTNNGDIDLDTVELMDDALGGNIPGPIPGTDENEDGVLSPDESWTFEYLYELVQEDIDAGFKENQATVSAEPLGLDITIQDDSDDNSLLENDITNTTVPNNACTDGAPSIGLDKSGQLADINSDGCNESILYTFTVTNTGELDLENVIVEDDKFNGTVNGPTEGSDLGEDGILSVGESWTYQALYTIQPADVSNGFVNNTASVSANPVGLQANVSQNASANTVVPNDACTNGSAGIGLIKESELADAKGGGCTDSIIYTFTVSNTGEVDLEELFLEDEKLGGYIVGPVPGTDNGNDGILSIGESWTFRVTYSLTQQDIDNGSVINQAMVSAQPVGFEVQIIDQSDDDSFDEDQQTVTTVPSDACPSEGTDPDFEIYTGITPNGDGINDFFRIDGIEAYPNNSLRIFNRWGALVYEAEGYGIGNQIFIGVSEGQATIMKERSLPSGTYFYILEFENENPGEASYSGYLYINRD